MGAGGLTWIVHRRPDFVSPCIGRCDAEIRAEAVGEILITSIFVVNIHQKQYINKTNFID